MVFLRKHWLKDEEREKSVVENFINFEHQNVYTKKETISERKRFYEILNACLKRTEWEWKIILQSHRCRYIFWFSLPSFLSPPCLAFNFRVINMPRHETDTIHWNDDRYEQICKQRRKREKSEILLFFPPQPHHLEFRILFFSCRKEGNRVRREI